MKAYTQSIYRSIKSNLSKLLSIFFIILLGIAFVSGIGTLSSMITNSFGEYYEEHNLPDLIIKDTSGEGFSLSEDEEVLDIEKDLSTYENYIKSTYVTVFDTSAVPALEETIIAQIEESMPGISSSISVDLLPDDFPLTRFSTIQQDQTIDTLTIVEGRFPESDDEIAVEQMQDSMIQYNVGDVINLGAAFGGYKKIVGIIKNPLVISKYGEPDLVNQDLLEQIIYFYGDTITINLNIQLGAISIPISQALPITDVYIDIDPGFGRYLTGIYENEIENRKEEILNSILKDYPNITILTLEQNTSYAYLRSYCAKIDIIAAVFPFFFIAVAALVVSSTMSRLVEEERSMIGCLNTLGYSEKKIVTKYLVLSLVTCLISCILGMILGLFLIPSIIYPCLKTTFFTPDLIYLFSPLLGLLSSLGMILVVTLISALTVKKTLKAQPATLLLPKSPKAGKTIVLEKIKPLWKRLPFRIKSSFRNIFRYKKNLVMTIISVAGSTAMIFAGLSLLNLADALVNDPVLSSLRDTIAPIAILIICFAIIMSAVVVYNLTNMNIGERIREIATLKVLGYKESEVHMYIYREVFIMTCFGAIFGLPVGVVLMYLVIQLLDLGSLSDIQWYTYILSIAIILAFVILVDALLSPKIKKVDMSTSLKSVD